MHENDPDAAAQLERLSRQHGLIIRDLVNEALRRGLRDMAGSREDARCCGPRRLILLVDIDVAQALGHLESKGFPPFSANSCRLLISRRGHRAPWCGYHAAELAGARRSASRSSSVATRSAIKLSG